jgi:pimeloyl-ACP methyl ester carboxylesterase
VEVGALLGEIAAGNGAVPVAPATPPAASDSAPATLVPIQLPDMESVTEATVVEWKKAVGEAFSRGDLLAESPGIWGFFKSRIDAPIDDLAGVRAAMATVAPMFELADPGFGRVPIRGTVRQSLLDTYVDDRKVTPELVDRYADLMRRPGNRAALGDRTRAGHRPTGWERLPELRVPTLLMWGGQDTWIPPSVAERFRRDIRGSELVVYPELGHLPMEEDPERTARDALSFLRRLGAV